MPVSLTFPGVYIDELVSPIRTIVGVPTSIAAFVGPAKAGPLNAPVHITSWSDFERQFGGLWDSSLMTYAVYHYYLNGGSEAEIVRVAKVTADPVVPPPVPPVVPPAPPAPVSTLAAAAAIDLQNGVKLVAVNVGAWGSALRARVDYKTKPKPAGAGDLFNLTIRNMDSGAQETFRNVEAKAGSPVALSAVLKSSLLVRTAGDSDDAQRPTASGPPAGGDPFANFTPPAPPGGAAPVVPEPPYRQAVGGEDGWSAGANAIVGNVELKGDEGAKTGLYALAQLDNRIFNLLCIPPASRGADLDFLDEAALFCSDHRAILLVDPPAGWTTLADAVAGAEGTVVSGDNAKNASLCFPRVQMLDAAGNLQSYPPSGAFAGVIARTDAQRGVWKAPAGTDASLAGVRGLDVGLTNLENGQLNPLGINCIRNFPVIGTVVWGSRTLRGADLLADQWKYLPVRRTALYIEESLYRGTQWVVFEPNDEPLWASIRLNIGAFMNSLWGQGAFQGRTPKDAYLVKCDAENNPQNDIDRGIVNVLVGFAPLKPAEFVVLHIQQLAGQIQT